VFNASLISGRLYKENNDYGQDFDHMAIIVELESKVFLVDVGFGRFIKEPIEIVLETIQLDAYGAFIINRFDDSYFRVSKLENFEKIPEYIFNLYKRKLPEFEKMYNFHKQVLSLILRRAKLFQ
jgi:N-hydroxyarylamine O-acetyltransferase